MIYDGKIVYAATVFKIECSLMSVLFQYHDILEFDCC